jgi:tellurite resistance protein TerC
MLQYARRIGILIIGSSVLLVGIAMIVLPGPAVVVIPIGLAILATEFMWARRWLKIMRETTEKGAEKLNLRSFFTRKNGANERQDTASSR